MRNVLFVFLLFLLLGGLFTAWYIFTDKPSVSLLEPCATCSIPLAFDEQGQEAKSDWSKAISPSIKAQVNSAVKGFVDAETSGGIDLSVKEERVTTTYQMTKPANLEKTQNANLYRLIACTFERAYCQDPRFSEVERQEKKLEVLLEFKKNINSLILDGKTIPGNEDEPSDSTGTKENITRKTESSKNDELQLTTSVSRIRNHGTDYLQVDNLDIALLIEGSHDDIFISKISTYLRRSKRLTSDPFGLNSKFFADFSSKYKKGDWSFLTDLNFENRLNCICNVISDLQETISEEDGLKFLTISGTTKVTIIHIPTGKSYHAAINTAGSGPLANESSAVQSYLENMLRSQDINALPFTLCQ